MRQRTGSPQLHARSGELMARAVRTFVIGADNLPRRGGELSQTLITETRPRAQSNLLSTKPTCRVNPA